jgi:hypothetical protein
MMKWDFSNPQHREWARDYFADREQERKEKARERAAGARRERELLNKHGFYARLRQVAEGGDRIVRSAQLRVRRMVAGEVGSALRDKERSRPLTPVDRRMQALNRLARDPGGTEGERAAAKAAIVRIRGAQQ